MAVKQAPVGAHYGLRDWLAQRLTAAVMTAASLALAAALLVCRPSNFQEWHEFATAGWVRILLFGVVLALVWHAYIGARDIIMDYIKNDGLRLFKIAAAATYLLGCLIGAAWILL